MFRSSCLNSRALHVFLCNISIALTTCSTTTSNDGRRTYRPSTSERDARRLVHRSTAGAQIQGPEIHKSVCTFNCYANRYWRGRRAEHEYGF
jgi:hypothetical protein